MIIVLDWGIKGVEEIGYGKEKGMDLMMCEEDVGDDILGGGVGIVNGKGGENRYG